MNIEGIVSPGFGGMPNSSASSIYSGINPDTIGRSSIYSGINPDTIGRSSIYSGINPDVTIGRSSMLSGSIIDTEVHDPAAWKKEYDSSDHLTRRRLREKTWRQTEEAAKKQTYLIVKDGKIYEVVLEKLLMDALYEDRNTLYCETEFIRLANFKKIYKTNILVTPKDSIDAAEELMMMGDYNPVILNLANHTTPGGGFRSGAAAQEESLFRRTNYFQFLDQEKYLYPIPEFGGIYSRNVLVFRNNEQMGYAFREQPFFMSFVAQSAYNKPRRSSTSNNRLSKELEKGTEKKIRSILKIGLNHGHDSFVLGAFGCGAFCNPPEHISEIFKKVISEFDGYYKLIVFAIIEDNNSTRNNKPGNFKIFQTTFQ